MTKKQKKSPWVVLFAILLGIICGSLTGVNTSLFGVSFYSVYNLFGKLFLNALMLIVVPLVSSSIITGVARIGNDHDFQRLGLKIFGFYLGTSLLAILIGLFFVNIFNPGISIHESGTIATALQPLNAAQTSIASESQLHFTDIILQLIPSNIVDAFHGQMLGLIVFSLLFGFAISKIEQKNHTILMGFWQGIFQAMLVITDIVMKFLPIGVFCLVAKSFATTGLGSLQSLALFCISVLAGLFTFTFIALPLLLKFMAKVDPRLHFKAMTPALITAFSTSSSSATLPVTIECVEKRAGVSNRICSLVVPLGNSVNMSGSALYECVAVIFIAQAYGVELSILTQFSVVLLSLIVSIGIGGIPSASLIAIVVILKTLGIPVEGIGLLIAVDRVLDMCRTTTNVFSDSCCAILVARSEGEEQVLKSHSF